MVETPYYDVSTNNLSADCQCFILLLELLRLLPGPLRLWRLLLSSCHHDVLMWLGSVLAVKL